MIKFLLWMSILLLPAVCHAQEKIRLDSLFNILEKPTNTLDKVRALTHALNYQKRNATENILRIKVFYGEKEVQQIELQYRIAQQEVNQYLDSMKHMIKDPDYIFHYDQYNAALEKALFSIRKLNILFEKYDYKTLIYTGSGIIESSKTIKKVIHRTSEMGKEFIADFDNHYEKSIREEGCFAILKRAYWCNWEDKELESQMPKQKRNHKR